jgi:Glycosyl hydrolase family 26
MSQLFPKHSKGRPGRALLAFAVATGFIVAANLGVSHANATSVNSLQEGVYVGAADPSGVASFGKATKTTPTIASDFLPSSSGWTAMDGANGSLDWLFAGAWSHSRYTLSLGIPIIPKNSAGVALGTLTAGASGAYDSHFVTLAKTLVAAHEGDAMLRLGWEFDGGIFAWSATTPAAEANYATYFRRIVTSMRSVPGQRFRFIWNPDVAAFNDGPYDVTAAYPGNAYVDYIGLDAYDQSSVSPRTGTNAWRETTLPDLALAQKFAASEGKPLAIPEWGEAINSSGTGLGDDPVYINRFLDWMKIPTHDVAYESYFNFDVPGQVDAITDGKFPDALAAFAADMSGPTHADTQSGWPAWASVAAVAVVIGAGGLGIWRISRRRRPPRPVTIET